MATTLQRGSATIYQFPLRGRFAAGDARDEAQPDRAALCASNAVDGSGWYHDQAIQDAERGRKN